MSLKSQKTTTTSIDWDVFKSLVSKLERDGNYKYCLLITIGVFTGLRISDLLQLRYSQFEDSEYLTVVEQKTKKTRKIKPPTPNGRGCIANITYRNNLKVLF